MSTETDQFAVPDGEYLDMVNTLHDYSATTEVAARLGIIAGDNTTFTTLLAPFVAIMLVMANKNAVNKIMTQKRDSTRAALTAFLRKFVAKWYYANLAATPNDILAAALWARSDSRIIHEGSAIEMTTMIVDSITGHMFQIAVKNQAGYAAKPANIVFMRVRYFMGADAPAEPADFQKMKDFSKHPIVLALPATLAGQEITISSCYVDAQGNEGPYCVVVKTNVT